MSTRKPLSEQRIAIVGSGLAGVACGRVLAGAGLHVTLFDKARGAGGRMSTRRTDLGPFDHGAQYFTARDPDFRAAVDTWRAEGVVAAWTGRIERVGATTEPDPSPGERFVGVPGMSALLRHAARDLQICYETQITAIERVSGAFRLQEAGGPPLRSFDQVIVAVPAPQAVPLLAVCPALAERVSTVHLAPCYTLMAAFDAPLPTSLDGIFFEGTQLAFAARDSSKPGRPAGERWVIHGHWDWSAAHLDDAPEDVAAALLSAFFGALGLQPVTPVAAATHRWRYALPISPLDTGFLYDATLGIGACGDGYGSPRVEGAWVSGTALGRAVLAAGAGRAVNPGAAATTE
jgi:renalase